jgi:hypothetical protein
MDRLKEIITPQLLRRIVDTWIPWSRTEPLDWKVVTGQIFSPPPSSDTTLDQDTRNALLVLSEFRTQSALPSLFELLPFASDPDFPIQALGLQMLVDQCPRRQCKGIDGRWTNAYFDLVSNQLAVALNEMPEPQRPSGWARWKEMATLDYWLVARIWYGAPLVHKDTVLSQEQALLYTNETRRQVEESTKTTDPYRAKREEILADIYGFPRVLEEGPPTGDGATLTGMAYWTCMLMDIHKPIVDKFGRYPYRNAFFGYEDTMEEKEWIEKTSGFAVPDREVREAIARDLEAGVWTPLGAGRKDV